MKVRTFNNLKAPPDVQKEEWAACASSDSFAQGEVGFQQQGDKLYEFIEKQVILYRIYYIKLSMFMYNVFSNFDIICYFLHIRQT